MTSDNQKPDAITEARGQFNRAVYELGAATYELELVKARHELALKKASTAAIAVNEIINKAKAELAAAASPEAKPALTLLDGGAADAPAKG